MKASSIEKITPERFLGWVSGRDERYELVEGRVVMMAGAGRRHDKIVVSLTAALHPQIAKGPSQTFTGDTYIAVSDHTRRMADLGVDCGNPADHAMTADAPVLLIEVLSPTTSGFDVTVKLAEYQALGSVQYILLLDTETPSVHLYRRGEDLRWADEIVEGLDASFDLVKLDVRLTLADIYAGLDFRSRPTLVQGL